MKETSLTDRQERIAGFKQSLIDRAVIGVIGAGRTANEVIKNLALTGFRSIFVCDMDSVSDTNLPGTVLFRKADVGEPKARLAAEGFERLAVAEGAKARWLCADACYGLGEGVLRRCDLVINCVDNTQTRLYISRICKLLEKPCVDIGISGFDWTHMASSPDSDKACYACVISPRDAHEALKRVRNSCDVTLAEAAKEDRAATIVTAAAMAGGKAVETAIKILHYEEREDRSYDPFYGVITSYSAASGRTESFRVPLREGCENHLSYRELGGIRPSGLSADDELGKVLERVRELYGEGYSLSLEKDCVPVSNKAFIRRAFCKCCQAPIEVYRPQSSLSDEDLLCEDCRAAGKIPLLPSRAERIYRFSLAETEERILGMKLRELGVPALHILEFVSGDESRLPLFLELDGDGKEENI